jgi:hypothetical protein
MSVTYANIPGVGETRINAALQDADLWGASSEPIAREPVSR